MTGQLPRALLLLCLAPPLAQAQELSATLGKQRAAGSTLEWATRGSNHLVLGPLRSAFLKSPVVTQVGNAKLYSRASLSCQSAVRTFAIELQTGTAESGAGGLKLVSDPRLYCSRPITSFDEKLVQEEMLASWQLGADGTALSKGLRPFPLRECVAIRVEQEVVLPPRWSQKTARIEFDIHPYNREVDSIFASCGEVSAYGAPEPVAESAPPPPPLPEPVAAPAAPTWLSARTTTSGKTNVRAAPKVNSALVDTLDPGTPVMVKKSGDDWWMAKSTSGVPFEGYIRGDRLVFK
ncbi:MAG: SH3 domain-containing protein [Usitatibacter sp.]